MVHGRDKYKSRESRMKVREVLMQEWDPIGVRDVPEAQDEYDRYADKAYIMLMDERATATAIAAYLDEIATRHLGFLPRPEGAENCRRVADFFLVNLRPQFELN